MLGPGRVARGAWRGADGHDRARERPSPWSAFDPISHLAACDVGPWPGRGFTRVGRLVRGGRVADVHERPRADGNWTMADRKNQMVINYVPGEECRVAIVESGKLEELHVERFASASRVGNIYVGKVMNVEAAIQAAFVDFGVGDNGFLHVSDLHPKYFPGEDDETTERVGFKTPRRERPSMQQALRRGDEVIVQVLKEGVGTKGPTLTSYLSIPGRFLVMMPGMDNVGVSRKVEDEDQRRKMREILDQLDLPEGFGFILRTAGMARTKAELKRDLAYLMRLWKDMEKRNRGGSKPRLLYSESDLLVRSLRDLMTNDVDEVVIDHEIALRRASRFMKIVAPRGTAQLLQYTGRTPIFHAFGIEPQVQTIHAREVPLPSGGRLVIDQTEALVAIDVNSGKSRDSRNSEENAYQTNIEAVDEICRQLRLRDMGGIVVNDLIDMRRAENRKDIEARFRERLKRDRARTTVGTISEFGILEMTRQRMRPSHESVHFAECPTCRGRGLVQKPESVAADALRDLAALLDVPKVGKAEIVVGARVAGELLSHKRRLLNRIERSYEKHVDVRVSEAHAQDRVSFYAYDETGADLAMEMMPKPRVQKDALVVWEQPKSGEEIDGSEDEAALARQLDAEPEPEEADEEDVHPIEIDEGDLAMEDEGEGAQGDGQAEGQGGRRRRRGRGRRGRGDAQDAGAARGGERGGERGGDRGGARAQGSDRGRDSGRDLAQGGRGRGPDRVEGSRGGGSAQGSGASGGPSVGQARSGGGRGPVRDERGAEDSQQGGEMNGDASQGGQGPGNGAQGPGNGAAGEVGEDGQRRRRRRRRRGRRGRGGEGGTDGGREAGVEGAGEPTPPSTPGPEARGGERRSGRPPTPIVRDGIIFGDHGDDDEVTGAAAKLPASAEDLPPPELDPNAPDETGGRGASPRSMTDTPSAGDVLPVSRGSDSDESDDGVQESAEALDALADGNGDGGGDGGEAGGKRRRRRRRRGRGRGRGEGASGEGSGEGTARGSDAGAEGVPSADASGGQEGGAGPARGRDGSGPEARSESRGDARSEPRAVRGPERAPERGSEAPRQPTLARGMPRTGTDGGRGGGGRDEGRGGRDGRRDGRRDGGPKADRPSPMPEPKSIKPESIRPDARSGGSDARPDAKPETKAGAPDAKAPKPRTLYGNIKRKLNPSELNKRPKPE